MTTPRSEKTTNEKLIDALRIGDYESACCLIKECKDINDPNIQGRFGAPILAAAIDPVGKSKEGLCHVEKLFDLLITAGVDVHKNRNGTDALLLIVYGSFWPEADSAIKTLRINITNKILDNKIDVNSTLASDKTALHLAAEEGDEDLCRLLIRRGANLCAVYDPFYFDTPIAGAFRYEKFKLAEELLEVAKTQANEKKCDLTAAIGMSVLSVLKKDHLPYLKKLLNLKANVNAQDWLKRTALHLIAERERIYTLSSSDRTQIKKLIQLLSAAGIDATIKDSADKTALQRTKEKWNRPENFLANLLYQCENRQVISRSLHNLLFPPLIQITNEYAVAFELEADASTTVCVKDV
ncbi:MAG: ankyrin repeat domain-containing protein [Gammaproteobacteria bacterium]